MKAGAAAARRGRRSSAPRASAEPATPRARSRGSGEIHENRGDRRAAALAYDRLDREYPALGRGPRQRRAKLLALASLLPAVPRGRARLPQHAQGAWPCWRRAATRTPRPPCAAVPLGRARRRGRATSSACGTHAPSSPCGRTSRAEKLLRARSRGLRRMPPKRVYQLARIRYRRGRSHRRLRGRGRRIPGHAVGRGGAPPARQRVPEGRARRRGGALLAPAARAVPGGPLRRARVLARFAGPTTGRGATRWPRRRLEKAARLRPPSNATAGFLYWAGRARAALGQTEAARGALEETVQRYKHTYHGLRAREAARAPGPGPARGDGRRPRRCSPRPAPERRASPRPRQHARPPAPAHRPAGSRAGRAAAAALLAPGPGHDGVDRLAAGPAAPRDHRHEDGLPGIRRGEAGDRLPAEVWRDPLSRSSFEDTLEGQGGRGGPRSRPRGRPHPAGVDLRRRAP